MNAFHDAVLLAMIATLSVIETGAFADDPLDQMMHQMDAKQSQHSTTTYEDFNDRDLDFIGDYCNYRTHIEGLVRIELPTFTGGLRDGTTASVYVELHPESPQIYGSAANAEECPSHLARERYRGSGVVHGDRLEVSNLSMAGGEWTASLAASLGNDMIPTTLKLTDRKIHASPLDFSFILSKKTSISTVPAGWNDPPRR